MRFAVLVAAVVASLSANLPDVAGGSACSGETDPVGNSDLIVAGRITGWRTVDPSELAGDPRVTAFVPIGVTLAVDRVHKGNVPTSDAFEFFDLGSFLDGTHWAGSSGACGIFNQEPSGYAIIGLFRADNGKYYANLLRVFYLGDEPSGPGYDRATSYLQERLPVVLPEGGGVPSPVGDKYPPLLSIGIALVALGGLILQLARRTE